MSIEQVISAIYGNSLPQDMVYDSRFNQDDWDIVYANAGLKVNMKRSCKTITALYKEKECHQDGDNL